MIDPFAFGVYLEQYLPDMERLAKGADGVTWSVSYYDFNLYPPIALPWRVKRVPQGTTPIYNYSDKLIGYTALQAKSRTPIQLAAMPTISIASFDPNKPIPQTASIKTVVLEAWSANSKPAFRVKDDTDLTDVRDVTLLRDPPAVQTNQQMCGEPVWYELTTQRFYFVDSYTQNRHNVTKEMEYYGKYRQAGTALYSNTAQSTSQSPGAVNPYTSPQRRGKSWYTQQAAYAAAAAGKRVAIVSAQGVQTLVPGLGVGQLGTTFSGVGCPICGSTQFCNCAQNLQMQQAAQYNIGNPYINQQTANALNNLSISQLQQMFQTYLAVDLARTEPLPREDPKLGEIIAWRGWAIDLPSRTLLSVARSQVKWEPGAVVQSSPPDDFYYSDVGIHAFKDKACATTYLTSDYGSRLVALGQVALWGEVVEGERGYRAEFARIVSIEAILNEKLGSPHNNKWERFRYFRPNRTLAELQAKYNNRKPSMGEESNEDECS